MDLITPPYVKTHLKISNSDTSHDDLITQLITQYSRVIEKFCNRAFAEMDYEEVYNGNGETTLFLNQYPVSEVSSLAIDSITYEDSDFVFYSEGKIKLTDGSVFTKGNQNVEISYTAGYSQIPEDVQLCCVELVAMKFKEIDSDRIGVTSQSFGDQSVSFGTSGLSGELKKILSAYKKIPV